MSSGFPQTCLARLSTLYVSRYFPIYFNISISQTFSPAKAIFAGVGVLLLVCVLLNPIFHGDILTTDFQAARGIPARRAMLKRIFVRMEWFFTRLEIYTCVPLTPAMTSIMADIIVEVISLLGFATKEIKQCRISELILSIVAILD